MRMSGHAHHDDMLFLGKEPSIGWDYPKLSRGAYADAGLYSFWAARDPIVIYATRLEAAGIITGSEIERLKQEALDLVETEARAVIDAPWPEPVDAGTRVYAGDSREQRVEPLEPESRLAVDLSPPLPPEDPGLPFDRKGHTLLDAIALGIADALRSDRRVFVYGEDVGGRYGNAFLLLRPLLAEFGDRIINSPIAESGVLGVCIGAALAGQRPIGEMQFNDFVASGFNQLVNNAAKIRYRWGGSVPMVVRMPWGGLRHAGPYHSQNTEAWFYRTPGLKIVAPSTPEDARALMAAAVADPDPVLFYEHIALYRDPRDQAAAPFVATGTAAARTGGASPRRRRPGDHLLWRLRPRGAAGRRATLAAEGIGQACSIFGRCRRSTTTPHPGGRPSLHAGARSSKRTRAPAASVRVSLRSSRSRHSSRSTRPCGSWARSIRPCPTHRRSRNTSCRRNRRSSAPPVC